MEYFDNNETTPRPLRAVNTDVVDSDDWFNHTPYIPRRKSSANDETIQQAASTTDLRGSEPALSRTNGRKRYSKPTFGFHQNASVSQVEIQRARFPVEGYDPVSHHSAEINKVLV